jgi:hypothetical protein
MTALRDAAHDSEGAAPIELIETVPPTLGAVIASTVYITKSAELDHYRFSEYYLVPLLANLCEAPKSLGVSGREGASDVHKAKRKKAKRSRSLTDLRREAEDTVEKHIDRLDMTDPRLDEREGPDDDLEPSLGGDDGRDLEEDRADEEPSLGWPEQFGAGGGDLWGGQDDREECVPVGTKAGCARFRASKVDEDLAAGVNVDRG